MRALRVVFFFCIFSSKRRGRRKKYARKNTPPKKKVPRSRHSFLSVFSKRTHFRPTLSNARARADRAAHFRSPLLLLLDFLPIPENWSSISSSSFFLRPTASKRCEREKTRARERRRRRRRKNRVPSQNRALALLARAVFPGRALLRWFDRTHDDTRGCADMWALFLSLSGTLKKGERKRHRFPHWGCTGGARDPPALRRRNGRKGLRDDDARRTAFDVSRHRCSFCGGRR